MAKALSIPLIAHRGDSPIFPFSLTSGGVAVDITGYVFEMTVDTKEFPPDSATELFTVAGVITVAASGTFSFQPTTVNLSTDLIAVFSDGEESKDFFYDISLVNGTNKVTIIKSSFTVFNDIGKA